MIGEWNHNSNGITIITCVVLWLGLFGLYAHHNSVHIQNPAQIIAEDRQLNESRILAITVVREGEKEDIPHLYAVVCTEEGVLKPILIDNIPTNPSIPSLSRAMLVFTDDNKAVEIKYE